MAADDGDPIERASDAAACVACAAAEIRHAGAALTAALRDLSAALGRLQSEREATP